MPNLPTTQAPKIKVYQRQPRAKAPVTIKHLKKPNQLLQNQTPKDAQLTIYNQSHQDAELTKHNQT